MMRQRTPYALTGLSSAVGLVVLLFEPFAVPAANDLGGGSLLVAGIQVLNMIILCVSPGDHHPYFWSLNPRTLILGFIVGTPIGATPVPMVKMLIRPQHVFFITVKRHRYVRTCYTADSYSLCR